MLFNSFAFLAFFAVFVPIYYLTPHRYRWPLLAAASLFFYATFRVDYLALLFAVSAVAYGAGLFIARPTGEVRPKEVRLKADTTKRQAVLVASIAAIAGVLAAAKLVPQAGLAGAAGLSFYSLSAISYLVDVHRRELAAERHFGRLLLYLAFFPKLLAGPIERARPFLEQLANPVAFSGSRVVSGLQLVLWGLFKKVVIADRLAVIRRRGVPAADVRPAGGPGDRDLLLRLSALLRLLRVFRHGDRHGPGPRLRSDGEFPAAVPRGVGRRVLVAPLASLARRPGSAITSTSRSAAAGSSRVRHAVEPDGGLPAERRVARSELDVRDLGRAEWPLCRRLDRVAASGLACRRQARSPGRCTRSSRSTRC